MLKGLRTFLALLAVAVFACGNVLSVMAEASEHAMGPHKSITSEGLIHSLGHGHVSAAGHAEDLIQSAETCEGYGCDTDENPGQPCFHVHAHCCDPSVFQSSEIALASPTMRNIEQALFDHALPDGAVVNPLLRPPRATV